MTPNYACTCGTTIRGCPIHSTTPYTYPTTSPMPAQQPTPLEQARESNARLEYRAAAGPGNTDWRVSGDEMSDNPKTSTELRAELEAANARLAELIVRESSLEDELKSVRESICELQGFYNSSGKIPRLKRELERELARERLRVRPRVRVSGGWNDRDWRFVKKTPKRIYLRSIERLDDEYFPIDGADRFKGTIHPDDLAAILEGRIK